MSTRSWASAIAIATTLAIAACAMPPSLNGGAGNRSAAEQAIKHEMGKLAISVAWPRKTQAIPFRATKMVIRLTKAGSAASPEHELPVMDASDAAFPDVVIDRGDNPLTSYGPTTYEWDIPQQADVRLSAILYEDDAVIGSDARVIDVIAGVHSHVGLNIVLNAANASHLTSISSDSLGVGDVITLTGSNFAKDREAWSKQVFFQIESDWRMGGSPHPSPSGGPMVEVERVYFPANRVEVVSDSEIRVTIPATFPYYPGQSSESGIPLLSRLWSYFRDPSAARLFIGVDVDGAATELKPVTFKPGALAADVTLTADAVAPAKASGRNGPLWVDDHYMDPAVESGSYWTYRVQGPSYWQQREVTVRISNPGGSWEGGAEILEGPQVAQVADLANHPEFDFMCFLNPQTRVYQQGFGPDNDTVTYTYTVPHFTRGGQKYPRPGAIREVTIRRNVGVVYMRETYLARFGDRIEREVREYGLMNSPVAPSAGTVWPTPWPSMTPVPGV